MTTDRQPPKSLRQGVQQHRSPRPVRVLRKRLKALGLWPAALRHAPQQPEIGVQAWATPADTAYLTSKRGYDAWVEANRFTDAARKDLVAALRTLARRPTISLLTPVHNTSPRHLWALIASIEAQVYDNWELCLSDDGSTDPGTLRALKALETARPNIRVVRLPENRGIAEATNAAAAVATGEIFAFVDHDDLITPDCLAEIALHFSENPGNDIVYSDDDKIGEDDRRYSPQFKPDFSPTLLLTFMYMSHIVAVRRQIFEDVGGIRTGFDGAQDYDFMLRAVERSRGVGHIPKILYHWRATKGSTAQSGAAKPQSFVAGLRAIGEALDRRGLKAAAYHSDWAKKAQIGMYSLKFPDTGPSITILIPTYNQHYFIKNCIESLKQTTYNNYNVLVVDNGSTDPETKTYLASVNKLEKHKVITIPQGPTGFSFSRLMNEAVKHTNGEYVLFLNDDTAVISPNWLSQMAGYAQIPGVGSVGARLYFNDDSLQHGGIVHGYHEGLAGHAFRGVRKYDFGYLSFSVCTREYSAVTAACMMTPKNLFLEMGGFNEEDFAVAYNDVDYGYRLSNRGLLNVYCASAELYHYEGKTRGYCDNPKEAFNFRRIHGHFVDKFYNANLSLENEMFEVGTRRHARRNAAPVRTCVISHNLNFEGAPNTLFDLVCGLKAIGAIDPVVLSPGPGPLAEAYADQGVDVIYFNAPAPGCSPEDHETAVTKLAELMQSCGAEAVIANTLPMFFAVTAAHRIGVGAVWCQHESEPWNTYFDAEVPSVRAGAYAAFGKAYRVTYVAEATRRAWAPVQTRQNAQVIRHGIPSARVAEDLGRWRRSDARAALGVAEHECMIVLMGTVCERKGQLDLVQALAHVDAPPSDFRIYIVGATTHDATYVERVQQAIAALPPALAERLIITGGVADMTLYYAAADISICTSRIESAPRIIVESMLFSLPIITTPVFGIPELVEPGVNATFYDAEDTKALAKEINRFISDPDLRASFGRRSRDVLDSKPGYEQMLEQYSSLLREAALSC